MKEKRYLDGRLPVSAVGKQPEYRSHQVMSRAAEALREVAWLGKGICNGLEPFAQNRHFAMHLDASCALLLVQRKREHFSSSQDLFASFDELESMLAPLDRAKLAFLGDTRLGPTSARFELELKQVRHKLLGGYRVSATLGGTAAGQMQKRRFAQQDGREILVTSDAGEAFAYLGLPRHHLPLL